MRTELEMAHIEEIDICTCSHIEDTWYEIILYIFNFTTAMTFRKSKRSKKYFGGNSQFHSRIFWL